MSHAPRHPIDSGLPELLRSEKHFRGVFHPLSCPSLVEMCAYAGFRFIVIDNEHGSSSFESTEHMLRAARASGIIPIVRCLPQDIARTLDLGPSGILVPMVESAQMAHDLVARIKYPPLGRRGCAFSTRAAGYGAFGGNSHTKLSNEQVAFVAMVETPEGVRWAKEIAGVDGVDAVFIGPNDLAHSHGKGADFRAPEIQELIKSIMATVVAAGKPVGILSPTADDEQRYKSWGASFFAPVSTSIITIALQAHVAKSIAADEDAARS